MHGSDLAKPFLRPGFYAFVTYASMDTKTYSNLKKHQKFFDYPLLLV